MPMGLSPLLKIVPADTGKIEALFPYFSKGFFLRHPFMKPDLDDDTPVNTDFVSDVVNILDQNL